MCSQRGGGWGGGEVKEGQQDLRASVAGLRQDRHRLAALLQQHDGALGALVALLSGMQFRG